MSYSSKPSSSSTTQTSTNHSHPPLQTGQDGVKIKQEVSSTSYSNLVRSSVTTTSQSLNNGNSIPVRSSVPTTAAAAGTVTTSTQKTNQQPQQQQVHQAHTQPNETNNALTKTPTPPPPLKSTTMVHLQKKYMSELEYMHREFRTLQRQLQTVKVNSGQETSKAKGRREKLQSFISLLEHTMKQITDGCNLERQGQGSQTTIKLENDEAAMEEFARSSALTKLTKEKEQEENVQRLEEHILANLLPVKEKLCKQLEAQGGLKRDPLGRPVVHGRGGSTGKPAKLPRLEK